MQQVVDDANIERAWKNVKANRGAPGPDGITIAEFPGWYRPRWAEILDKELERRGLPFVRYADDFAVFAKSLKAAQRIKRSVTRFLTEQLRLVVNEEKSQVVACEQFEFLGFSFPKSRGNINVAPKSVQRFKQRIRELTGRSQGISMDQRLGRLRSYLRG